MFIASKRNALRPAPVGHKSAKSNRFWSILLLILITFQTIVGGVSTVYAQEDLPRNPSDDEVNEIASRLYCPVCENIPLDVCPTQACAEWRDLIRLKLSEGWDADQIRDYFVEQYGGRVLATPPPSGFNWLAYVIPPIAIGLGVFLLYKAFQSMRPKAEAEIVAERPVVPVEQEEQDDYIDRLEQQLRER